MPGGFTFDDFAIDFTAQTVTCAAGHSKGHHWLHHRVAALNLRRLANLGLDHHGTTWALA